MVKDHYSKLGFAIISEDTEGGRTFELPLASFVRSDLPFGIVDNFVNVSDSKGVHSGRQTGSFPTVDPHGSAETRSGAEVVPM
jgi:hypothetical protein